MYKRIIVLIIGGLMMFGLFGCGMKSELKDEKLVFFRNSSGGDMNGGGHSTLISIVDGAVILTDSGKSWWYEDEEITEYRLDPAVLSDIERIFRKYNMQTWNQKKFTDMFVADGASVSYAFGFENNIQISFSSQIYPTAYAKKLSEITQVVKTYREKGTPKPGLVTKERTDEEHALKNHPDNGLVEIEVYAYYTDRLAFRIFNGTDESVSISDTVKLVQNSNEEVLYDKSSEYPIDVDATSTDEESIRLPGRLKEGMYTLYVGDYSTEFEIRLQDGQE